MLLLNLVIQSGLSAVSNPDWFTLIFQQWDNFWNNTINLNDENNGYTNRYITFGQLQSRPKVWTTPPFPDWELLTIEVLIPGDQMRLYKVGDSTKWFNYTLMLKEIRTVAPLERIHYPTIFSYVFPVQCGLVASTTTEFSINIQPMHGGGNGRFGTYTTQIVFNVYDKEHALLAKKCYDFILYNKFRGDGNSDFYSVLLIERYPTASDIDIEYLQQHSSEKLDVGAVTFVSNETCGMYYLNFSPSPDSSNPFCFVNEATPSCTIPYKVVDPLDSSISRSHQFDLALPYTPDGTGWRDRLEIAIRNANYTNIIPRAGCYRSVIKIELRNN
ncbi:MAG: hypothetical protein CVV52_04135 [Spirochaetae bacterium HGW-Spirochaetae-8]|nr:MAG: hypothetical protein CVV52_04135 [Spirochaetae bacterium HGW-Spirochaetae-8]